jgi:hypothetical protein
MPLENQKTGAFPSPRHRLAGAKPFIPTVVPPSQWGIVAPTYQMWGNDQYGDCVTAESAANIANFSAALGIAERVMSDKQVTDWARDHRFLNGAVITDVLDAMQVARGDGLKDAYAMYMEGNYNSVNWQNRGLLSSAIFESKGNVKAGIASACLGDAVQGKNGWYVLLCPKNRGLDHCISYCGYGPLSYLCGLCGVPVPISADPNLFCYLLYTWACVGIVSEAALWNMTGEAWVRNPSSIAKPAYPAPQPPVPPVPPTPDPSPCRSIARLTITFLQDLFALIEPYLEGRVR